MKCQVRDCESEEERSVVLEMQDFWSSIKGQKWFYKPGVRVEVHLCAEHYIEVKAADLVREVEEELRRP